MADRVDRLAAKAGEAYRHRQRERLIASSRRGDPGTFSSPREDLAEDARGVPDYLIMYEVGAGWIGAEPGDVPEAS